MKFKIFLLSFSTIALIFLATHYFFVIDTKQNLVMTLKDNVSRATSLYKHINRADSFARINKAVELANKKELLDAIDLEDKENYEEIAEKIQVELNIINRFQDTSDIIFVTDIDGYVIARNLDDTLKGMIFKDKILIKSAIAGSAGEDVFKIMGKLHRVISVPIKKDCKVIGTISFANQIDSEMAKIDFRTLAEETSEEKQKTPLYFAFLDLKNKEFLGSNMPPDFHTSLKAQLNSNQNFSQDVIKDDAERKFAFNMVLAGEKFYANVSAHPQLNQMKRVHYIILSSVDNVTRPLKSKKNNFLFFTALIIVLSFIIAFVLEESFMAPVNKFMEGMLEIINGNKKYRFSNDTEGLEGSLNQNANYMISVLLGEKEPAAEKNNKED